MEEVGELGEMWEVGQVWEVGEVLAQHPQHPRLQVLWETPHLPLVQASVLQLANRPIAPQVPLIQASALQLAEASALQLPTHTDYRLGVAKGFPNTPQLPLRSRNTNTPIRLLRQDPTWPGWQ